MPLLVRRRRGQPRRLAGHRGDHQRVQREPRIRAVRRRSAAPRCATRRSGNGAKGDPRLPTGEMVFAARQVRRSKTRISTRRSKRRGVGIARDPAPAAAADATPASSIRTPTRRPASARATPASCSSTATTSLAGIRRAGEERRAGCAGLAEHGDPGPVAHHGSGRRGSARRPDTIENDARRRRRQQVRPDDFFKRREDPRRHRPRIDPQVVHLARRSRRARSCCSGSCRPHRGSFDWTHEGHQARIRSACSCRTPVATRRSRCTDECQRADGKPRPADVQRQAILTNFKVEPVRVHHRLVRPAEDSRPDRREARRVVDMHPGDEAVAFGGPLEFVNELRDDHPVERVLRPAEPLGHAERHHRQLLAQSAVDRASASSRSTRLDRCRFPLPFDASRRGDVQLLPNGNARSASPCRCSAAAAFSRSASAPRACARSRPRSSSARRSRSISASPAAASRSRRASTSTGSSTGKLGRAGRLRAPARRAVGARARSRRRSRSICSSRTSRRPASRSSGAKRRSTSKSTCCSSAGRVSVNCRREFGGSDGDPKFIELVPDQATWDEYCEAFAAEAAYRWPARISPSSGRRFRTATRRTARSRVSVLLSPRLEPQAQPKVLASSRFRRLAGLAGDVQHRDTHHHDRRCQRLGSPRSDVRTEPYRPGVRRTRLRRLAGVCSPATVVRAPVHLQDLVQPPGALVRHRRRGGSRSAAVHQARRQRERTDAQGDRHRGRPAVVAPNRPDRRPRLDRVANDRQTGLRAPERQFAQFMKTGLVSDDKLAETISRSSSCSTRRR